MPPSELPDLFPAPHQGATLSLVELWAAQLPQWLDPHSPSLADAVADGGWLAAWGRLAAFSPVVAFVVGLLAPLPWPGMGTAYVFTESLWFMALITAGSILSGTVGVMLLAGYICGDFLWETIRIQQSYGAPTVWFAVAYRASRVPAYLLLMLLAYRIPTLARSLAQSLLVTIADNGVVSVAWRAAVYSVTCGMLVFLWCQGVIVLIRPVFTWVGRNPTVEAVAPVQRQWHWLVAAAVAAALARVVIEHVKSSQLPDSSHGRDIQARRHAAQRQRALHARHHRPAWSRTVVTAGTTTMLLAGAYVAWVDALFTLVISSLLALWQIGRFGGLPAGWVRLMHRIPALLRFGAVPLAGYVLGSQLLEMTWAFDSLRPVLMAILGTLVVYCLLFPREQLQPSVAGGETT